MKSKFTNIPMHLQKFDSDGDLYLDSTVPSKVSTLIKDFTLLRRRPRPGRDDLGEIQENRLLLSEVEDLYNKKLLAREENKMPLERVDTNKVPTKEVKTEVNNVQGTKSPTTPPTGTNQFYSEDPRKPSKHARKPIKSRRYPSFSQGFVIRSGKRGTSIKVQEVSPKYAMLAIILFSGGMKSSEDFDTSHKATKNTGGKAETSSRIDHNLQENVSKPMIAERAIEENSDNGAACIQTPMGCKVMPARVGRREEAETP